ncbi:MAG: tRNA isopentenyl-2-thiomethyl-A-37 hydroxylase MiaE [Pseudomonadota bacterium]
MNDPLHRLRAFLRTPTPTAWCEHAVRHLDVLLLDHANCEMKAAQTALSLIYRYPQHGELSQKMSRLAREELRHFEQVQRWIDEFEITRRKLGPSRYAGALLAATSDVEPERLYQRLIVGALIEARSCERFAALLDYLPASLTPFYRGLLESEARHFENYLDLAAGLAGAREALTVDVERLCALEATLITEPDPVFRFHSGLPKSASLDTQSEVAAVPA